MLSDGTIRKLLANNHLVIDPLPPDNAYQPASVDLRLGRSFVAISATGARRPTVLAPHVDTVWLAPGRCVLATTVERVELPADIVARVEGKSTWGRRFLLVHTTAGFIDPGFHGQITLELTNLSPVALNLPVDEPIAQVSFDYLDAAAVRPYGSAGLDSRYQDQVGATPAAATRREQWLLSGYCPTINASQVWCARPAGHAGRHGSIRRPDPNTPVDRANPVWVEWRH